MAKSEEEGRGERGKALTGCISGHPFSFLLFSPPSSYSLLYEAPSAMACPAVAMMFIAVSRTQHRHVKKKKNILFTPPTCGLGFFGDISEKHITSFELCLCVLVDRDREKKRDIMYVRPPY